MTVQGRLAPAVPWEAGASATSVAGRGLPVGSRPLRGLRPPAVVCQRTDPGAKRLETLRIPSSKGKDMTVARITEISSVSGESFQHAIAQGVERANKTLQNVKGAWVKDHEVMIDKGKITGYKVILKVTFVLSD